MSLKIFFFLQFGTYTKMADNNHFWSKYSQGTFKGLNKLKVKTISNVDFRLNFCTFLMMYNNMLEMQSSKY